ncbi:unnamed protein product [Danaus chrysippus]|uniref:(African queen) hypothetical protein n=1 Tax=Danaus chrysippus TaxID=151541 RepID=A0A8J2QID7_9NEOP|nr:unnamed protein product [Danaus chrysippus]
MMLLKYSSRGGSGYTALFLVTSLASRGSTQAAFVTRNKLPVLKADAIKYIITFMSLLPKNLFATALPLLIKHIGVGDVVSCRKAASGRPSDQDTAGAHS